MIKEYLLRKGCLQDRDGIMTAKRGTGAGIRVRAQQPSLSSHVIFQKLEAMEINKVQRNLVLEKSSIKINDDSELCGTI